MKKLIVAITVGFLFLIPVISYAQPEQNVQMAPPASQVLIREGDFAIKLVEVLRLGTAKNEAEAESMLASAGIAPKNGWIANYPLTPDIIGELRRAIGAALDSGKIAMKKDEALKAVQILIDNQWRMPAAPGEEQTREYGEYPPAGAGGERAPGTAPPPLPPPPAPSTSGMVASPSLELRSTSMPLRQNTCSLIPLKWLSYQEHMCTWYQTLIWIFFSIMAIGTALMQDVGTSPSPTTDHGCILIPLGCLESC